MSISSYTTSPQGLATKVTVVSSLTGTVYYNWYQDGQFIAQTLNPSYMFAVQSGQQAVILCIDSNSATLPADQAGWPSTRSLEYVRSQDATVARYRVEQQQDAGSWVAVGFAADDTSAWAYTFQTDALDDLSSYAWRVVPIGANGNDGTPVALAAELIVRTPDAPDFTVSVGIIAGGFSSGFSSGFSGYGGTGLTFAAA